MDDLLHWMKQVGRVAGILFVAGLALALLRTPARTTSPAAASFEYRAPYLTEGSLRDAVPYDEIASLSFVRDGKTPANPRGPSIPTLVARGAVIERVDCDVARGEWTCKTADAPMQLYRPEISCEGQPNVGAPRVLIESCSIACKAERLYSASEVGWGAMIFAPMLLAVGICAWGH